jgi:hypothetical protein
MKINLSVTGIHLRILNGLQEQLLRCFHEVLVKWATECNINR